LFEPWETEYVPQFYNDKARYSEADPLTVEYEKTIKGINAALAVGGTISGKVTDAKTKAALAEIEVCALSPSEEIYERCEVTEAGGEYSIRGLAPGSYKVVFAPIADSYVEQFYDEKSSYEEAKLVVVMAEQTTVNIDAALHMAPPVDIFPPTVTGVAQPGNTLTEHHGAWAYGPTGYEYQWLRCNSAGEACEAIAGASSATYVVGGADGGHTIRVREIAVNATGAGLPATSNATALVPTGSTGTPPGGGGAGGGGSSTTGGTSTVSTGGGSSATTGVLGSKETAVTTAQLQAALLAALVPSGKSGKLASIRKHGGYQTSFDALLAGTVTISWYEVPKGAHLAKAKPVLVATVRASIAAPGVVKLTLKLASKGARLLEHSHQLKLTAQGIFTPAGAAAVKATKPFTLR
jgi:hypothetical protein